MPLALFLFLSLGTLGIITSSWLPPRANFLYLNVLLLLYLGFELWRYARSRPARWLTNPAVLSSLVNFGTFLGITNFLFFVPSVHEDFIFGDLWKGDFRSLNTVMLLTLLAAFAMWRGYYSVIGGRLASAATQSRFLSKILRRGYELNLPLVLTLFGISVAARFLQVSLGLWSWATSSPMAALSYREYIAIAGSLGKLALIAVCLGYFFRKSGRQHLRLPLMFVFCTELLFGLLSGTKYEALVPVLLLAFCAYITKSPMVRWLLLCLPFYYVLVFHIIEPYRILRLEGTETEGTEFIEVWELVLVAVSGEGREKLGEGTRWTFYMIRRFNYTLMASHAIEYKQLGRLTDEDPRFLRDMFWSPVYAIVPRFLWPSKPLVEYGGWFNRTVLGRNNMGAVGMSPIGSLYLAAGSAGVAVGFFLIGVWQRILFQGFYYRGSGGMVLFVGMLIPLVIMPDAVHPIVVNVIRLGPLLLLAQFAIFKK